MKTLKTYFVVAALAFGLFFSSCKKDLDRNSVNDPSTEEVTAFKDLKVDNSFNWKNDRSVALHVTPLNVPAEISNTLKVYSTDQTYLYFNARLSMNQEFNSQIIIPHHVKEVLVTYGTIKKTVPVIGNQINFDFLTAE
jgi:hypothetical protein